MVHISTHAALLALTFGSAFARPRNNYVSRNSEQSVVTLRLISADPVPNGQQQPSADPGTILKVLVGQTLSRDTEPLNLRGIEVLSVSTGVTLEGKPVDPRSVVCTAAKNFSSRIAGEFALSSGLVMLDNGKKVVITQIACY